MADKKNLELFTIGLDIGIASVGWALLSNERIIDIGVRCFDKAETADKGESLNLARRTARLARRRLRRRAWRLTKLARLLQREGLISDINILRKSPHKGLKAVNPWRLRVAGLDRRLGDEEWARVIYHICKHRGFHWISKAEAKAADSDKEGGRVKQGLKGTERLMRENNYQTAAEMVLGEFVQQDGEPLLDRLGDPIPMGAARNKQGEYSKSLSRELLDEELRQLFERQRDFGNQHASETFELEIRGNGDKKSGLFWEQHPALSGESLLKMLGKCTFERDEYRAPKASFSAERHVLLTRINNLRLIEDGKRRALTEAERQIALLQPYQRTGDFTYKQLGDALVKADYLVKDSYRFAGLSYPRESDAKAKDPESRALVKLPAWQLLKKTLTSAGLENEWNQISGAALDGDPGKFDDIAWVLSVYKDDDEVKQQLQKLELPGGERMIKALQLIRFDKFSNLSLKALRRIVPHMERGLRYDEACMEAGYHHSLPDIDQNKRKRKYLPPFYKGRDKTGQLILNDEMDIPRNPVVLRALNQSRKVVNALIRKYGAPHAVHIEMARDLSRPFDERKKIERAQNEYRDRNQQDRETFANEFDIIGAPKGRDVEKWRLYREQQGKCAYSLYPIDLDRLLEQGYVEVDHVLPYSRSYDDSKNNRVLVFTHENRNKGNRTPYEYLDGKNDSEAWRHFESFVNTNKSYRQAKRNRLLKKDFSGEEASGFRDRNLNDTRYICRFFKNYVEKYLQLSEESTNKRCVVLSGQLTAFLRFHWGLNKVRAENDRHHALDAAVVAACSHGLVKRLSDYSRRRELEDARDVIDAETGEIVNPELLERLEQEFPEPWPHFRDELDSRIKIDSPEVLRSTLMSLGNYPEDALNSVKPLFVSRALKTRGSGCMHDATIRSAKYLNEGHAVVRIPLSKLSLAKLGDIVGAGDGRNSTLIDLLEARLKEHGDNGVKAFADPVYKPSPTKNSPIVRTVKIKVPQKTGMRVRNGVAELGPMLNVDVYIVHEKFVVDPVYSATESSLLYKKEIPTDAKFLFTLRKNDFVRIYLGNQIYDGYFVHFESDGRLTLRAHDQPVPDKKYFRKLIANAKRIEKFHIDILGNIYPALPRSRRDLA